MIKGKFTKKTGDIIIDYSSKLDSSFPDFWNETRDHYEFIFEREESLMDWRLFERAGKYIILHAKGKNELVGYCVLRINRFESSNLVGYFVDLLALPGRDDVLDELVLESMKFFDKNGVNVVNAMCNKGNFKEKNIAQSWFCGQQNSTQGFSEPF